MTIQILQISDQAFLSALKSILERQSHDWLGVPIEIPVSVAVSLLGFFFGGYLERKTKSRAEVRDLIQAEIHFYHRIDALLKPAIEQASEFDSFALILESPKLQPLDLKNAQTLSIDIFIGQSHDQLFKALVLNKGPLSTKTNEAVSKIYDAIGGIFALVKGYPENFAHFDRLNERYQESLNNYLERFQDFVNSFASRSKTNSLSGEPARFYQEVDPITAELQQKRIAMPNEPGIFIPFFKKLEAVAKKWAAIDDATSLLKIVQSYDLDYRNYSNLRKQYAILFRDYAKAIRKRDTEIRDAMKLLKDTPARLPSFIPGRYTTMSIEQAQNTGVPSPPESTSER
jgi:hypothetical protein